MRDRFLLFGAPQITDDDVQEVVATLKSGWIGTGPRAAELEKVFSCYTGSAYAAALSSCTAALHLTMMSLGIKPGDEVITSPMTFCATANAIVHAGARPVFADVDPMTGLIDPREVERRITPKTKAIIPIHLCGRACDMDALLDLAKARNLFSIEDCAHAIETTYRGKHAGTLGDAGCFSLYVTKNVTAIEGGLLITDRSFLVEKVKTLALHGMTADAWNRFSDAGYKHYEVDHPGYKNNLPDVHAALALSQMKRVETNLAWREEIWRRYDEAFRDLPCWIPPACEPETRHARHLYTLLLDIDGLTIDRDRFLQELHARKIGGGVHYRSLHLHRYYRETYDLKSEDYPQAFWHSERTVSLPLSAALTDRDTFDVIEAVRDILIQYRK